MAYEKFIQNVESTKLLKEIEQFLIFGKHCNRDYEGEVKGRGDQVTIKGLGEPTIYTINKDGTYAANAVGTGSVAGTGKDVIHKGIPDAEEIAGSEVKIQVNRMELFNYMVGKIDSELSKEYNLVNKYRTKTAKRMANKKDQYIASSIVGFADAENTGTDTYTAGTGTYLTAGDDIAADSGASTPAYYNILDFIDEQVEIFNERGYGDNETFFGEVTPKFWRCLKKALRKENTDNSRLIEGREITTYNGIDFVKTNNAVVNVVEYCIIRNGEAVTFINAIAEIQPYKPEKGFGDALKGFSLYDVGIIQPKGMLWSKILGYSI